MFTADEYERVQGAAAASSRTLSSWLRVLALDAVDDGTRPAAPAGRGRRADAGGAPTAG